MSSVTLLREIAVWRRLLRVSLKTFSFNPFSCTFDSYPAKALWKNYSDSVAYMPAPFSSMVYWRCRRKSFSEYQ
uniref:Uncharacterized protein n=1 Tax=Anguilla anguilla TaxID=7936 RepID=A0A0E9R166_ANGAN